MKMDQDRRAKSFMVVLLVLGLLVGQSYADFDECYKECFIKCMVGPDASVETCIRKCLKECIVSSITSLHDKQQTHSLCKLACAYYLCTNLSSKNHPGEEKVGSCVNNCSNRCTKNYSP